MPSESDDRLLGRIDESVKGIVVELKQQREDFKAFRLEDLGSHREISLKIDAEAQASEAGRIALTKLTSVVSAHVSDDRRSFSLLWRAVFALVMVIGVSFSIVKLLGLDRS